MNGIKKLVVLFLICFSISLSSCNKKNEEELKILKEASNEIFIQELIYDDITLPLSIGNVSASWTSSNLDVLSNTGKAFFQDTDIFVTLKVILKYGNSSLEKEYNVTVLNKNSIDVINNKLNKDVESFEMVSETISDLEFVTSYKNYNVTWHSKNSNIISNTGKVNRKEFDQEAQVVAVFSIGELSTSKSFNIKVLKYSELEFIQLTLENISIPSAVFFDIKDEMKINLPDGYKATWKSSDELVIDSTGVVNRQEGTKDIKLTITISGKEETMSKDFNVKVYDKNSELVKPHQIIEKAINFNKAAFDNVMLNNNKLVLKEDAIIGSYESDEISTLNFSSLIASWAATSTKTSTVELMVKAKVNNVWSDYITYNPWGFGLENKCYDQNNGLIKLSDDEVVVINENASCIRYKVILRRDTLNNVSPELSLVSFALEVSNYKFKVDISKLEKEKIYIVPKLYQIAVPSIGNSICSPTTSTMLLKYMGEDFSMYDEFEHRYIAYKFKEYNSGIFGNWVYNTVGMSSFGYDAYVARMYSVDELIYHLSTVGPCGLSVKGQMTSTEKSYYTNGHLIVAIGYKYIDNVLYIVCNDPNVPNVYCEYSINVIKNTWRDIAYVIK